MDQNHGSKKKALVISMFPSQRPEKGVKKKTKLVVKTLVFLEISVEYITLW